MRTLDNFIDEVKNLPPAPQVLAKLMAVLKEDDAPASHVVDLIALDPALTAKILQRCNSAASGLGHHIVDLNEAVTQVGLDTIFRLVAVVIGESALGAAQPGYGMALGGLWEHSLTTAVAARAVAQKLDGDENLAFTAGLLHDVGKLVLSVYLEGSLNAILSKTGPSGLSFLDAEKVILGANHAEVGGRVLARWHFPENFVSAVAHHHDPIKARPHEQLAAVVHLGDIIAHYIGAAPGFESFAVNPHTNALEILELTREDMELFVIEASSALEEFNWLLQPAT
jgi:putative nucleotidyltransferase with HDIG domain